MWIFWLHVPVSIIQECVFNYVRQLWQHSVALSCISHLNNKSRQTYWHSTIFGIRVMVRVWDISFGNRILYIIFSIKLKGKGYGPSTPIESIPIHIHHLAITTIRKSKPSEIPQSNYCHDCLKGLSSKTPKVHIEILFSEIKNDWCILKFGCL